MLQRLLPQKEFSRVNHHNYGIPRNEFTAALLATKASYHGVVTKTKSPTRSRVQIVAPDHKKEVPGLHRRYQSYSTFIIPAALLATKASYRRFAPTILWACRSGSAAPTNLCVPPNVYRNLRLGPSSKGASRACRLDWEYVTTYPLQRREGSKSQYGLRKSNILEISRKIL